MSTEIRTLRVDTVTKNLLDKYSKHRGVPIKSSSELALCWWIKKQSQNGAPIVNLGKNQIVSESAVLQVSMTVKKELLSFVEGRGITQKFCASVAIRSWIAEQERLEKEVKNGNSH